MTEKNHEKIAIRVSNLHKTFRIPLEGGNNLKQRIVNFARHKKGYREFSPLNGVTFEIKKGEFFGIVGRNGSGKSTLLKTIAGIYQPNSGDVKVNGKLVPFIELGVGFNPELTGRENVYLNGALLGFSRDEMTQMFDEIVDFAELYDFMDERLKNYSSGMQVRLAFSIAIRAKGDVLLLDEVLAVGDSAFQQKCYDYFGQLKEDGRTVILVSHSMSAVQKFCTSALLLEKGKVEAIGTSDEIASLYDDMFIRERSQQDHSAENKKDEGGETKQPEKIVIDECYITQEGKKTDVVKAFENFKLHLKIRSTERLSKANIGFNIKNSQGHVLSAFSTKYQLGVLELLPDEVINLVIDIENIFTNGNYQVNSAVADSIKGSEFMIEKKRDIISFGVSGVLHYKDSLVHPKVEIHKS